MMNVLAKDSANQNKEPIEVRYLVLGAGVTGLAFADALAAQGQGHECLILERETEPGGYCRSTRRNGYVWDYSGHFFHFRDASLREELLGRMRALGHTVHEVSRLSKVAVCDRTIDFPFQRNIHQLPQAEFLRCLHDLYFVAGSAAPGARAPNLASRTSESVASLAQSESFYDMLYARFGRAMAELFLIPYNEKLYATDLRNLDQDAMGRFFPYCDIADLLRHFVDPQPAGYNAHFFYPEAGASAYIEALSTRLEPQALRLGEGAERIDLATRTVYTRLGSYRYEQLVSSAPLPKLLELCGETPPAELSWNQVEVFNLGFDRKGVRDLHWLYVPDRDICFYRVGCYDNCVGGDKLSLYVEIGHTATTDASELRSRAPETLARILADLRRIRLINDEQLVDWQQLILDPAYVHVSQAANTFAEEKRRELSRQVVHSIGRYGRWTYCSIEDNILEARALASAL